MVPKLRFSIKQRLLRWPRHCRDAGLILILGSLQHGRSHAQTATVLHKHRTTIYCRARRFCDQAEVGLLDRREDTGPARLDERFLATLNDLVRSNPRTQSFSRQRR